MDESTPALLRDAAERGIHYLEGLDARAVEADPEAVERLRAALDRPLPEGPSDPAKNHRWKSHTLI